MTSNSINHASSLSIFLWNANGLKQNSNELFYLLHHKNIDIALITETHLSTTSNISFNGYSIIRADHPDRTSHGGAATIIKSSLFYNEMPSTNESYLQAANIKIKINNFNITISSAYFPPNQPISEPKILSFFHSLGNFLIIGGDFNAKHSQWGNAEIASTTTNPFLSSGPVDWKLFQAELDESLSLNTPLKCPLDIDLAISKLTKTIQNAVSHSSLTTPKKNQSKSHISLPSYLVNLIKAKRHARSLWQRSKYPEHKTAYNHLSNDLKSQLAKYRSEQFSQYLSTLSPNNGSLWKITKKLTNQRENIPSLERPDKSLAITDLEKANLFGAHLFSTFSPHPEIIPSPDHTDLVNSSLSSPLPMWPCPFLPNRFLHPKS
eukprot:XP_008185316.1 PREDICTED: RNA-directed DNA polymerase from mobile element jockey-like [Acyrthosiphon pisum]